MRARFPAIDYADVRPDWAPNREFAHNVNASSTIPAYVEPYLIKVMQRAKLVLPAREEQLHREIDIFIAQEAQHFRQHNKFNRRIRETYPAILRHEKQLEQDYEEQLKQRSLKFNLAYCEGFESMGPPAAIMWFERYDQFLEGADHAPVALWKWHMAEEYEHREVCFRLFRSLYARSLWGRFWNGWLYRCYGFLSAARHLGAYSKTVSMELIATDRGKMAPAEVERSKENARIFATHLKKNTLPQLAKIFSPFYDPGKKPEPRGLTEYLRRFEKGGDMGMASAAR